MQHSQLYKLSYRHVACLNPGYRHSYHVYTGDELEKDKDLTVVTMRYARL